MSAGSTLDSLRQNLPAVVADVLRTMVNLQASETDAPGVDPEELFTAAVYFAGDWLGAMLLECPPASAFALTRRLMGVPEPTAFDGDVRDTLGELANMVAGNLKAVLPAGTALSMPTVVSGRDYSFRICGVTSLDTAWFAGAGVVLRVSVMQMGAGRALRPA